MPTDQSSGGNPLAEIPSSQLCQADTEANHDSKEMASNTTQLK